MSMQEYESALAIRKKYPARLTATHIAKIVEALPGNPTREDMVGLALVHHSGREPNSSEIKLYWAYRVKWVGSEAARCQKIFRKEPVAALARSQCALLGACMDRAIESLAANPKAAERVTSEMVAAWKKNTTKKLWAIQKGWFKKLLEIKNTVAEKYIDQPGVAVRHKLVTKIFTEAQA